MSTIVTPYSDNPHVNVSATTDFEATSDSDWNLESVLQFVSDGGAALFDFSIFAFVDAAVGTSVEKTREKVQKEIDAFTALKDAVVAAHADFLDKALEAVRCLNRLEHEVPEPS